MDQKRISLEVWTRLLRFAEVKSNEPLKSFGIAVLTDAGGEDVSREEDERLAVPADGLDGREEPGGPAHRLHQPAVHVVDVVEVEERDRVRLGFRHLL